MNMPNDIASSNETCMTVVDPKKQPTVIVVIGMAGSGKTTMMKALWEHFNKPQVMIYDTKSSDESTNKKTKPIISNLPGAHEPSSPMLKQFDDSNNSIELDSNNLCQPSSSTESFPVTRKKQRTYIINLDPAVIHVPYPINIDIRDTIQYKEVMKQYKLGPNGAIMTSLNLFATKFDQVHELLNKRSADLDIILIDTPGQIEVFNWSASGSIILDTLAISFPTIILYVLDTARCQSPITFMSNMMYACGVLYKSKLPFIMAFNKIDVRSADECFKWMQDYDSYSNAVTDDESYMSSLSRSCGLVMNEFYEGISVSYNSHSITTDVLYNVILCHKSVGVSAATTVGFNDLEIKIQHSRTEYFQQYLPWLEEQRDAIKERRRQLAEKEEKRFQKDKGQQQHVSNKYPVEDDDFEEEEEQTRFKQYKSRNIKEGYTLKI